MFDNLLLLSKGRIVFQGPAAKAVPYFASIGHPCPIVCLPVCAWITCLMHRRLVREPGGLLDEGPPPRRQEHRPQERRC